MVRFKIAVFGLLAIECVLAAPLEYAVPAVPGRTLGGLASGCIAASGVETPVAGRLWL